MREAKRHKKKAMVATAQDGRKPLRETERKWLDIRPEGISARKAEACVSVLALESARTRLPGDSARTWVPST